MITSIETKFGKGALSFFIMNIDTSGCPLICLKAIGWYFSAYDSLSFLNLAW